MSKKWREIESAIDDLGERAYSVKDSAERILLKEAKGWEAVLWDRNVKDLEVAADLLSRVAHRIP